MDRVIAVVRDLCIVAGALTACWLLAGVAKPAENLLWSANRTVSHFDALLLDASPDIAAATHSLSVILARSEETAASVSGIAADVRQITYKASQPMTTGQKIKAWRGVGALVVSKFVP